MNLYNFLLAGVLAVTFTTPGKVSAQEQTGSPDFYSGHYSRDGNNESPSSASGNNIYIKFFEGQWIATLFVPYPYATTVEPAVITKALEQAKKRTSTSAYIRGDFGQLEQSATAQIERFGYLEDRIVYECGSLAPCTINLGDGFLEQIKPGVINEHIIRYNHVTHQ
jgi:hypothetical protein